MYKIIGIFQYSLHFVVALFLRTLFNGYNCITVVNNHSSSIYYFIS